MRNLQLLYTKNVYFCFRGDIYQQNDGAVMDPQLGPVLAGIFMVELKTREYQRLRIAFHIGEDL